MPATRLAAIAFVDVEGFADLVGADEKGALALLARFRSLADPLVAEYSGELADATNDELMVLFDSALAALQFALHLRMAARVGTEPLRIRAGLHLGEIWREGSRVYGNGVNVAARVMQAASGDEILVSEDVWRQVSNKLELRASTIRDAGLKNIERELVLWRIEDEDAVPEPSPPLDGAEERSSAPALKIAEPPPPPSVEPVAGGRAANRVREALEAALLRGAEARRRDEAATDGLSDLERLERLNLHVELGTGEDGSSRLTLRSREAPGPERLQALREKAVSRLVRGVLASLAFGVFAWRVNSLWLWGTTILLGFLPAISGLRQLVELGGRRGKRGSGGSGSR